jgi:predicted DNA-binding transcriptional regulator YafY
MNQFDRIFALHRLLKARRTGIAFDDLLLKLDLKRTTLQRTLDFLRDALNAPLIHDRQLGGYLYTDERYELPGLWFSASELSALLLLDEVIAQHPLGLLSAALLPARSRIENLLQQSGAGIPAWRSRLRLLRIAARDSGSQFHLVAEAVAQRRRLRIDYHARSDDRMQPRIVSPQRLTLYRENWYLDAWCHQREALRIFSLDRVIAAEVLGEPALDVAEDQLQRVLATSYGIFAGEPDAMAVLRFSAHASRWVSAETWHPEQQDRRDEQDRLIRSLPYRRAEELLMDLLRHGPEVEVLAPDSLRRELVARLERTLAQYSAAANMALDGVGSEGAERNAPRKIATNRN